MNNQIFYFFYGLAHRSVFLDKTIIFFADTLPYLVCIFASFYLVFHHRIHVHQKPFNEFIRKWKEFFYVFFSGGFAWLLAKVLKIVIHTERPFRIFSDVTPLFNESGLAFPSGHATFFSALGFAVFMKHRKAGYVFLLFALLIGLARIAAGVHFPIDILGGFALGFVIAYFLKNI